MIIDCHGHYTTAPEAHNRWRQAQVAAYDAHEAAPAYPTISDDEIAESIEVEPTADPARAWRRHDDLLAARLGHGAPRRRRGGEPSVVARLQRPHQARRRPLSRRRSSASRNSPSRPAPGFEGSIEELERMRARTRLRRLQPESRSERRQVERATAHRSLLVPDLRKDGRARRAGDDPRVEQLQSELSRHRRPLHQRRHDGVHATHPG